MIDPQSFLSALISAGFSFYTGVPDSLLKSLCACISDNISDTNHIIAPNEGASIGLAIGSYLATGSPSVVYMQNSGLGNAINPLVSLADPLVYSIPMLLIIGWRGEITSDNEQIKDEPQHNKQGLITLDLLDTLDIPYKILDVDSSSLDPYTSDLFQESLRRNGPVALVVRKGSFSSYLSKHTLTQPYSLTREQAIRSVLNSIPPESPVIATTGMTSRELFEIRQSIFHNQHRDFLTVGGMGHAIQIASGIALARQDLPVVCLDGDGALLMHSGSLSTSSTLSNLIHVVLNNEAHDSVGGQPTRASQLSLTDIAKSFGYSESYCVSTEREILNLTDLFKKQTGSVFIEIKCLKGHRSNLGRPSTSPLQNKLSVMSFLNSTNAQ